QHAAQHHHRAEADLAGEPASGAGNRGTLDGLGRGRRRLGGGRRGIGGWVRRCVSGHHPLASRPSPMPITLGQGPCQRTGATGVASRVWLREHRLMARSKRKPSGRAKARPVATPSEPEDLEALTSDEAAAADGQDSAQKPEGDAATGDPDATDAPDRADAQASSEADDVGGRRGGGGKSGTAAGTKDPVTKKSAKDPVAPSRDKAGTAGTAGKSAKNTKHTKNAESTSGSKSASGNQNTHRGQNSKSAQGSSGGKSAGAATAKSSRDEVAEKAKDPARPRSPKKTAAAEAARSGRRAAVPAQNPRWLVPTALTLLIVGLAYLVTYYLSAGTLPLPIDDWNLAV